MTSDRLYRSKLGLDEAKTKNFLYYYKNKIILGVLAIIILGVMIRGCIMNVSPDLNITLIGSVYIPDEQVETLNTKIKQNFSDIKAINVENLYTAGALESEQDIAIQQKVMLVLTVGDTDIVIMDRVNYERYASQGAFLNLDEYTDSWGIDKEKNKENSVVLEDTGEKHLYGVDVADSVFLKDVGISGKEKIAAIKFNAKNKEKTMKVFPYIIK
jgi:ABC-type glycerol-3-phosphate transport system substrate-binding protein